MQPEAQCILCGTLLPGNAEGVHREAGGCPGCGLNARLRGVLFATLRELVGQPSVHLHRLPPCPELKVLGISDHDTFAAAMRPLFDYQNTFFHREPFLDICDPGSIATRQDFDVVVCSDVIEHTFLPLSATVRNLLAMVRKGGSLVLSAPTFHMPASIEWYGGLATYTVERGENGFEVHWRDVRGQTHIDCMPIFHGGPGSVLEMRVIAHDELVTLACAAGRSAEVVEFAPEWGYVWTPVRERSYIAGTGDGRVIVIRK